MNSPTAILIVRWLVYVTFRQALASRLFWVTAGVSGLCILLCLSVRVTGAPPLPTEPWEARYRLPREEVARLGPGKADGVDPASSELKVLFGAVRVQYRHYGEDAIQFIQLLLAGFVADTAGILLALIWTAGFLPGFLEPASATVLLAKPVPRWSLLVGKYLGVLGFVTLQAVFFVGGTWLALGASTGVWTPLYLLSVPILLVHFAVFFSVSAGLAVCTRSTVVSMVGALAFWLLCWGTNTGWHVCQLAGTSGAGTAPAWAHPLLGAGYWLLPKPADLNGLLFDALHADKFFGQFLNFHTLQSRGLLHLELSILTSLLFAAGVLALSVYRFAKTDY
jgi:ABC-type transport system involved in multi-copper enzyme maturation permease subunit